MTAEILPINDSAISVQNIGHQLATSTTFTAIVAAVRDEDGRWHLINSAGIEVASLALASFFIQAKVAEMVLEP